MPETFRLPWFRWTRVMKPREVRLPGTIGILGYGVDGRGVVEYLKEQEEIKAIRIFDDIVTRYSLFDGNVRMGENLDGVNLLFRSPGFPLTHPLVTDAKKRGIPITSSTSYFLQHYPGMTVGVTGSNGKTTCSTLMFEMLKAEFGEERVEEGGNDRTPRLDLLAETKNQKLETKNSFTVLELSSFQLIDCSVSPNISVVLNVTPNHLDWHTGMKEYAEAKRQIVAHQVSGIRCQGSGVRDTAVLNQNDPIVKSFAKGLRSELRWFEDPPRCDVRCRTHPDTIRAAATAARALGVSEEKIIRVLESFPGVPHRIEFVRELNGVRWYNDSSCTTPESAVVTCNAFPVGSLILLLGGRDKGMDFSRLYEVIEKRKVRIVPYGEMAETFEANVTKNYKLKTRNSFEEAVTTARDIAKEGDNIVLSPACASFDMFTNAKERGEKFTEIVQGL